MAELALCNNIILKEALTVRSLSLVWTSIFKFLLCFWSSMMSESANVASLGAMPTAQPSSTGIRKQWHEDITQDLRNHLVHKLWVANNKTRGWDVELVRVGEKERQEARWRCSCFSCSPWRCTCCFGAIVLEVFHSILSPSTHQEHHLGTAAVP